MVNRMKSIFPALLALALIFSGAPAGSQSEWPTQAWSTSTPSELGLDARVLSALDTDIGAGKYGYVDSMLVIRHGKIAYERYYGHDYGRIYSKEASTRGPLVVGDLTGPYNYFNDWWHPYYQDSDLHTMQSVTKTVVSVIVGIAVTRGDFPDLDTPVLDFFEPGSVAHVDARKRRMTIRHVLTMTTGLDWREDIPYTDPENSWSELQSSNDWVQFTIDRAMIREPGEAFVYNSGATLVLGHIFNVATGVDLEEYAVRYLFRPLGIDEYFWKRTMSGIVDTQEGLYVSSRDIAKILYLFTRNGMWEGRQVVSEQWIDNSVAPFVPASEDGSWKYGYKWWLPHYQYRGEDRVALAGSGFGGQIPVALPELDLVFIFTGWNTLPDRPRLSTNVAIKRVLEAVVD